MRILLTAVAAGLTACGAQPSQDSPDGAADGTMFDVSPLPSAYTPTGGPFGISKGAAVADLDATPAADGSPGQFDLASFPKPHPDFTSLSVSASPATGVCRVLATGREIVNDYPGTMVRTTVDQVAEQLKLRYGAPRKIDWCDTTTTNCRPGFWIVDLENGSRGYGYSWEATAAKPLANDLARIELFVISTQAHHAFAQLNYTFDNEKACTAAQNQAASSAL